MFLTDHVYCASLCSGVRHAAARTLLPHHLLSVAELRSVGPRFHASLGFSSSPALDSSLASPFQDGLLLCGIVSQLQHAPLPGVVTTPTAHQQKSQASRRAVAMHNIETALNQLRKNQVRDKCCGRAPSSVAREEVPLIIPFACLFSSVSSSACPSHTSTERQLSRSCITMLLSSAHC